MTEKEKLIAYMKIQIEKIKKDIVNQEAILQNLLEQLEELNQQ